MEGRPTFKKILRETLKYPKPKFRKTQFNPSYYRNIFMRPSPLDDPYYRPIQMPSRLLRQFLLPSSTASHTSKPTGAKHTQMPSRLHRHILLPSSTASRTRKHCLQNITKQFHLLTDSNNLDAYLALAYFQLQKSNFNHCKNEGREIRTPNLLIWSQTRCRCAIPPMTYTAHPDVLGSLRVAFFYSFLVV